MRLLILTQYYPPEIGAPQTRLAAMARELRRRGHDVEVVTAMPHHLLGRVYPRYRGKVYLRETIDGVRVHRTWVYAATGTGARRILNYLSFAVSCLAGLCMARRPDALFVESPPLFLTLPGWIAAVLWRAKFIFNVADLWPDSVRDFGVLSGGPLLRLAERLELWSYRRAHYVNAVTVGIDRVLREHKHVPDAKLRFLPNGVDVDHFTPRPPNARLRASLDLDDRPVFIYAGTHGIAHGLETLVDAAALLRDEAMLLFVGAGPTKPFVMKRARDYRLDNVRFIDPVAIQEMPEYFAMAYASLVSIVRNGVMNGARPSKLFPALSCGVPVIYSGEGEGARLIDDAGAGIVVPPQDPQALAAAIRALISDPASHARMSAAARALAVDRFAWSSIVGAWLKSLELGKAIA